MNYRHAFHAGNAADCMKHAILVWLLRAMARKDKPFFVLDTHAGTGRTDLAAEPARRTGEAARGIMRLLDDTPAPLADYVGLVHALGLYPGSPALIAALLRSTDRAAFCELHPDDHAALRRRFGRQGGMSVHLRDGYEAIGALLPPLERRGLTLIDPPYEQSGEYDRMLAGLATAQRRLAGGIVMAWYPIKHRAPIRALHEAVRAGALRHVVACELLFREPLDPSRLNGSGMLLVNPPFGWEAAVPPLLSALLERLGDREPGEAIGVVRLADA